MPSLFDFDMNGFLCIIPDDKGGFYTCTHAGDHLLQRSTEAIRVSSPCRIFLLCSGWALALYRADERGAFPEIEDTVVRNIRLTGDMLQHPAYQAGVRNFEIYWSNVTGKAFLFLQNNLYQLKKDTGW